MKLTKEQLTKVEDAQALLHKAKDLLDSMRCEIEEVVDGRSESWKDGEKGQVVTDWLSDLEDQVRELDELADGLEDRFGQIGSV